VEQLNKQPWKSFPILKSDRAFVQSQV
jgi:hypothetical protein